METGRQDGGSDQNHAPFSVGKTGNISRKFLTIILKIFDKSFGRLHNDVASLNGIPSESNALLQNCLRLIQKEEDAYQAEILRKQQEETKKTDDTKQVEQVVPVKVIKNKPVSFRTITGNKTYSIKNEEDIDKVVEELRAALKAQLEEDTIIKLS